MRLGRSEPILNVPWSTGALVVALWLVHAIRQALSAPDDEWLVLMLAFIPLRVTEWLDWLPGGALAIPASFVTHMLVHGDIGHLLLNSAWLAVFGTIVCRRIGHLRFMALVLVTGVAGALLFLLVNPILAAPVIGASGAVSGLMGAAMRFLFRALEYGGVAGLQEAAMRVPRLSLGELLVDRRVLTATALWLGLNVVTSLGLGGLISPGGIAWEAHVGGFVAGLLLFGAFDRLAPEPEPAEELGA